MTPLEYKEKKLPLPVLAFVIIRQLKENKFVRVKVLKINRKSVNVEFPDGVIVHGYRHDDITQIGDIE